MTLRYILEQQNPRLHGRENSTDGLSSIKCLVFVMVNVGFYCEQEFKFETFTTSDTCFILLRSDWFM